MKLYGNSKRSKHSAGKQYEKPEKEKAPSKKAAKKELKELERKEKKAKKPKKKGRKLRVFIIVLVVLLAVGAGGYAFLMGYIRPPDSLGNILPAAGGESGENDDSPAGRYDGKYTFMVLGCDDGNGNTDTIMVGTFDAKAHTLNVVSIPRDTLVNVSWSTKKVNTLYGSGNIDRAKEGLSDLLGYELDFYAVVDLEAFVKLVDAIGGVWYDVPDVEGDGKGMNYEDPAQDLYIHLTPGYQLLDGNEAVGVVRYRHGYSSADIGRIGTQQDFLLAAAGQIIENKDSISLTDLITIFLNYVETDLDYGECAWFAKELFKMDIENITFHTLPGKYDDYIHQGTRNVSYVTIYVDEWLEMINTYLNPFDKPITESNLNILTRDPSTGKIYSTSGEYADDPSWGN